MTTTNDKPDKAEIIQLWRERLANAPTLTDIEQAVAEVHLQMDDLYRWAERNNKKTVAKRIEKAWLTVQGMKGQIAEMDFVLRDAQDIVGQSMGARKDALDELDKLMRALNDEGEHPKVADFADRVANEEYECLLEGALEDADMIADDAMRHGLHNLFIQSGMVGVDGRTAANELMRIIDGDRNLSAYIMDEVRALGEAISAYVDRRERGEVA